MSFDERIQAWKKKIPFLFATDPIDQEELAKKVDAAHKMESFMDSPHKAVVFGVITAIMNSAIRNQTYSSLTPDQRVRQSYIIEDMQRIVNEMDEIIRSGNEAAKILSNIKEKK